MKNKIYLFIIFLIVIVCFCVLFIYYYQEFKEEILIKDSLSSDDVNYDLRSDYVYNTQAEIGIINLTNNGIFTQIYYPELMSGCLRFKSGIGTYYDNKTGEYTIVESDYAFPKMVYISLSNLPIPSDSSSQGSSIVEKYYSDSANIEILAGKTKTYYLIAKYSNNLQNFYLPEFKRRIVALDIYSLKEKNQNPLGEYGYSSRFNCESIPSDAKLVKTINISLE